MDPGYNDALLALDPSARTMRSDGLRAVFLPGRGMLGASLQHRGEELLGRLEDIASFAQSGRTCGIPLLHPWANRLGAMRYRAAGKNERGFLSRHYQYLIFDDLVKSHKSRRSRGGGSPEWVD